ncbi:MAG: hypothetical protein JNK04_25610 [Myxococcales bacterium]|nr:hypothetical protein [Myxococcales bacterium]
MRPRSPLLPPLVALAIGCLPASVACSSGGSPAQDPADGATSAQPLASAEAPASSAPPVMAATAIGSMGDITNTPASGVVMDNATPPGTNAPATRLQPIIDVMVANREGFRACFDPWGQANPGRELKITLTIKLDKHGTLTSAAFKPDETDIVDKPMEACMQSAAKALAFPASPNGQETRYNHRFVFKAKKS